MKFLREYTISTHAPAGGATNTAKPSSRTKTISTHAPAGGATLPQMDAAAEIGVFLLTPLREGRPRRRGYPSPYLNYFYSRPCGRGDRYESVRACQAAYYFYSRPCGRGDPVAAAVFRYRDISTHAPAGGATAFSHNLVVAIEAISTHAPAGGTTKRAGILNADTKKISTHAPAGGATEWWQ